MIRRNGPHAIAWILIVLMIVHPALALAQVDSGMAQFFNSFNGIVTGTPPGAYDSQTRGYFTGGAISARVPMQSTSLLALNSPQFNLGCNGFDVTFGGLSYVSLNRFIQLLQQLGTGAVVGFAFQLAMQFMSPTIASVLSQIEAAVRFVNNLANVQPCQLGMQIGRALAKGEFDIPMLQQRFSAASGAISDVLEGSENIWSRTKSTVAQALAGDAQWTIQGNIVWDTLRNAMTGLTIDDVLLIMSVVGTVVVNQTGEPVTYPPLLRVQDLISATPGQAYQVYQCPDTSMCLAPTVQTLTNLTGFAERITQQLTNLANALQNNQSIEQPLRAWVHYSPVPIYSILREHRGNPQAMATLISYSSRLIASELARQYLRELLHHLTAALSRYKSQKPNWNGDITVITDNIHEAMRAAEEVSYREAQLITNTLLASEKMVNQSSWNFYKR